MKRLYPILALLVLILAACGSVATQATTSTATPTPTDTPTPDANAGGPAPSATVAGACGSKCGTTASSTLAGTGTTLSSGTWDVTVNSVKTSQGGQYDQALKPGDIYLTISFTLKNMSATAQSVWLFTLRDEAGTTYDQTYIDGDRQSYGTIVAGQQLTGDLSYEVPASLHTFMLQFDPIGDYDGSEIVQFAIKD